MNMIDEEPERHEIEALLPWYAAGTLSRRDADLVERALARDSELARRYDLVRQELTETIHLNEALGAPSARAMEKLFAAIDAEEAGSARRRRRRTPLEAPAHTRGFLLLTVHRLGPVDAPNRAARHCVGQMVMRRTNPLPRGKSPTRRPASRDRRVGASWMIPVLVAVQMPAQFLQCAKRSGLRSPALASSTIRLAMIPSAKLSASPRETRVFSSATPRTCLVSGSTSKSSR
jgi:hypothetical protein